jgi:hypothetical protein
MARAGARIQRVHKATLVWCLAGQQRLRSGRWLAADPGKRTFS